MLLFRYKTTPKKNEGIDLEIFFVNKNKIKVSLFTLFDSPTALH